MNSSEHDAVAIQREYCTKTAAQYDAMHAGEGDAQPEILRSVHALLQMVQPGTLLDVGSGTGRGIQFLRGAIPNLSAFGIEPVHALIDQSVEKGRVPAGITLQGSGGALPFKDASIDVVCSFAILHHVREPNKIVREMLRVARKAVLIVGSNRFGQGSWAARVLKLALYKMGLWRVVNYVKTRGKGYMISEGDGLAYSYSVYDSFDCLASAAAHLVVNPAGAVKAKSGSTPC